MSEDFDPTFAQPQRQGPKQVPGPNDPHDLTPEEMQALAEVFGPGEESQGATLPEPPEIPVGEPEDGVPPDPTPQTDRMHGLRGTPHRDAWDAEQRRKAIEATAELEGMPAYQNFAQAEAEFEERKEAYRAAFLKAYRKKESK